MEFPSMQKQPLTEDDLECLEALVKSPVFRSLRKLLGQYRDESMGRLMTETDPHRIFELRGKILGLNTIENLPQIRAMEHAAKKEVIAKQQELKEQMEKRDFRKRPERAPKRDLK